MKHRVCYLASALAALLLQLSFSAHAFTLGNLRGAAVLGRPLDVSVQVQAGPEEVLSDNCLTADVFYADARQSAVKVTVLPVAGVPSGSAVRVQSSAAIDEPVVTVEVRANCGSRTLRRYVLLADFPVQAVATAVPRSMPDAVIAPPVLVLPTPAPSEQSLAAVPTKPARHGATKLPSANAASRPASVKPKKAQAPAQSTEHTLAHKAAPRAPGKSVLKLDPLDLLSDRIDALDPAMLFAPTEDALRYGRQIVALEGDVKTLRALAASNDAKLSDLTIQLQQAQASQVPLWLVYGLLALVLALLLACLAAVMWLWKQQQRTPRDASNRWWHGPEIDASTKWFPSAESTVPTPMSSPVQPNQPTAPGVAVAPLPVQAPAVSMTEVDFNLDQVMQTVPQHGSFAAETMSAPFELGSIRRISVEPILDIRQQAEFFVSLGQTERGVQILKKQITDSTEPNPLVYLDLIKLFHSQGMKAEFRECRDKFHGLFNAHIPDFASFELEGSDLEAYPEVLAQLATLWPSIDALAFLSTCIFQGASGQHKLTFDLAAFRDLLLLHALAAALVADQPASAAAVLSARVASTVTAVSVPVLPLQEREVASSEESASQMLDLNFTDFGDLPASPRKQ